MSNRNMSGSERFLSRVTVALVICAVVLVAALALESKLANRGEIISASTDVEATSAPLILHVSDVETTAEPAPTEAQTTISAAPIMEEVTYEFLPVYSKAETDEKVIAITLDGCADAAWLESAMRVVYNAGGKLTLFPYGNVVMREDIAPLLVGAVNYLGWEIENRTWSNRKVYALESAEMASEIWSADVAVDGILNARYDMHFFRMINNSGSRDVRLHEYLRLLGYDGIVTGTYVNDSMTDRELRDSLRPGMIYEFGTTQKQVERLSYLVSFAQYNGYRLVTVNELLDFDENKCEPAADAVTSQTMPLLTDENIPMIELRSGDSAWMVYRMQQRLIELNYLSATADGVFGSATGSALVEFQNNNGLVGTGIATTQTQTVLYSENAKAKVVPLF